MAYTLFVGCSYTYGTGFPLTKDDPDLWTNIFHSSNDYLKDTTCINAGISGASNEEIFANSVNKLLEYKPCYAFIEWTCYPRYRLLLGVETYYANQLFVEPGECFNHNLHNVSYTSKYLNNIKDRFFSLHHPHKGIIDIIKYTNILITLAKTIGTKIFFINGLCPWDYNYFVVLDNELPNDYTLYTQQILDCATRDDEQIFKLYDKIHSEYQEAGGIQANNWLNLYQSMESGLIDNYTCNMHPGKKSNQSYSNIFNQALNSKLNG